MKTTILFVILVLATSSQALAESFEEKKERWMSKGNTNIEHYLSKNDESVSIPIIYTLTSIWVKRDGATSSEVSPLLAEAIIHEPKLTFLSLKEHGESYKRWLEELQGALFTDYQGTQREVLQSLHTELLNSLQEYITNENDMALKSLAIELQNRVKQIRVRVVD